MAVATILSDWHSVAQPRAEPFDAYQIYFDCAMRQDTFISHWLLTNSVTVSERRVITRRAMRDA